MCSFALPWCIARAIASARAHSRPHTGTCSLLETPCLLWYLLPAAATLQLAPAADAAQTVQATATRVVDGDTVWADDAQG